MREERKNAGSGAKMTESGLRKGEEERIRIASPFCCTLKDVFGTCRVCTIGQVEEERKVQVFRNCTRVDGGGFDGAR